MKKLIGLAGLLMLIAAGCEQYSIDVTETQSADAASGIRVYASIEQPVSADTKVYADANLRVLWNANDTISFFNQMTLNEMWGFTGVDGANSGYFDRLTTQVGTGNDLDFYCAVYPYDGSVAISNEGVMALTLPAVQKYAANSFGRGANTMIGVSANPTFSFKNVGGFLSFKLYGDGVNVSSITLKGNNNELIAGEGTIPIALDSLPKITMSGTATKEITLVCNPPVAIGSSASAYTEFFMVVPPTTFSAGFSVTITDDHGRRVSKVLNSSLEIKRSSIRRMAPLEVVLADPEAVDLGLPSGLKWATFNVGAAQPEETGYFLAWGETAPKGNYSLGVYSLWTGSGHQYTKYSTTPYSCPEGETPDGIVILDPEDDAASVNWGGDWVTPNADEWAELRENCTWTWTTLNGVDGYNVASTTNSNSIFLPVTGYMKETSTIAADTHGAYWSSSLREANPTQAMCANVSSINVTMQGISARERGLAVRPVCNTQHVTSVALDMSWVTLTAGQDFELNATLTPSVVHNPTITWTSSNPVVADVVSISGTNARIRGFHHGTATITATSVDGGYTAVCLLNVMPDVVPVDLGLPSGVKWASLNLGADDPEDVGDYFAWGETAPKENSYNLESYSLWAGSGHQFTKYTTTSSTYVSAPDNKLILETEDDAASVNWGGEWQIPNADEWAELKENCTWTWTTVDGKDGYNVASTTNSNSIFLPVTGYRYNGDFVSTGNGFYWSSSLIPTRAHQALCTNISSGNVFVTNMANRERGLVIRPVSNTQHVTSVALDKTELTLAVLEDADLTATLTPSLVHVPTLTWTSSNPSVVMLFDRYIYGEGKIRGLAPGTATITVTTVDGGYTASCTVTVVEPEAVDLGLPSGRKWASFNVGAHAPEEYGGHFAWAETAVKDNYDWPTYAFAQGSGTNVLFTKYVATDAYGTVDNILTLESDDDVAAQSWSGGWRIPTDAMWTELRNNCTWTWTTLNGVDGYRVASTRNSNSIFLPAAGMVEGVSLNFSSTVGYYWSASLEQSNSARARAITFSSSGINMAGRYRSKGLSVRAVK